MSCLIHTQRIIRYLLFILLAFSHQCFAADVKDETPEEEQENMANDFFRFTTKKRHIWEDWTHEPIIEPPPKYGHFGGGDPKIFFIILGVGVIIFMCLLLLCKRARDEMTDTGSRTIPGTVTQTPTAGAAAIDVTISFMGSASSNPSQGRSGISRQTSEKPPDYATVTLGDLSNKKSLFPSVVRQRSYETPPPKYDDNNPMFR